VTAVEVNEKRALESGVAIRLVQLRINTEDGDPAERGGTVGARRKLEYQAFVATPIPPGAAWE
jgi:hypothetical protein